MASHSTLRPVAAALAALTGLLLAVPHVQAAEAGGLQFKPRGRLLVDSVSQVASPSGAGEVRTDLVRVRQAFLGLDTRVSDRLMIRMEGGASNNDAFVWDQVAVEYRVSPAILVAAGNLKAAGLENLTSTRSISFLERGPYGDLVTDPFTSSVQVRVNAGALVGTLAAQGDTFNNLGLDFDGTAAAGARDRRGVTLRLAGALQPGDTDRLHLGVWARVRDFGDEANRSYAARPGTSVGRSGDWLGSGSFSRGDSTAGLEFAWMRGPFWVQAEAARLVAERSPRAAPGGDPVLVAGYVYAGWNLAGEGRGYDGPRGLVSIPGVRSPLSKGGLGSLDLLARYDFADLTDVRDSALTDAGRFSARRAGDYRGLTLGAVWRPEPGFRVVLNLSEARVEYARPQPDVRIRLLQLRAQYDF